MSNLVAVNSEDFAGTATHEGAAIHAAVGTLLKQTHAEAMRLAVSEVRVDLMQLELMSSSCFKCFVAWINDIAELPEGSRYKVTFIANPQKRSLHSLRCFAIALITVIEG